MDAVLTAALGSIPELGGVGAFVLVVVLLIRREVQTAERFGTELDRQGRIHDEETAELRAENERLRGQRDAAEQQLRQMWQEQHPAGPPDGGGRSPWAG